MQYNNVIGQQQQSKNSLPNIDNIEYFILHEQRITLRCPTAIRTEKVISHTRTIAKPVMIASSNDMNRTQISKMHACQRRTDNARRHDRKFVQEKENIGGRPFLSGLSDNTPKAQGFKEPTQVLLLNLNHAMFEAVDSDSSISLLNHFLKCDTEAVTDKSFVSIPPLLVF